MEWIRGPIIGRGSSATVSLATSISSGELFAVKSMESSTSMFLQKEQYILSQLSSPYIVKYIGFDIRDENRSRFTCNLCMEYVAGGNLQNVIRRNGGQLVEAVIKAYTRNILQGLDYLHVNGLVHCDIKSQNVLVHKDGAKLADFGCARYVEENGTAASVFSGTTAFMAPEVARGEEQGYPADVWAVGCTVIEMATGTSPWAELSDPVSALYRIGFSGEVPEFPSSFSDQGKDFLSKCLNRDPTERWTAKELLQHPFLEDSDKSQYCSKETGESNTSTSPSCVLDHGFWDSVETSNHDSTVDEAFSDFPAERMKRLTERINSLVSDHDVLNRRWEEDWITVRGSDTEESNNAIALANESSVATLSPLSDTLYERARTLKAQAELFMRISHWNYT